MSDRPRSEERIGGKEWHRRQAGKPISGRVGDDGRGEEVGRRGTPTPSPEPPSVRGRHTSTHSSLGTGMNAVYANLLIFQSEIVFGV